MRFDGFLKVYEVSEDKKDEDDETREPAAEPGRREGAGDWTSCCPKSTLRSRLRATTKLRW